jgi:hypothetical protein
MAPAKKTASLAKIAPQRSRMLPVAFYALFLAGVFLLFVIVGFVGDIAGLGQQSRLSFALTTLITAAFAVLYAIAGFALRKDWWKGIVPLFVVHFSLILAVNKWAPAPAQPKMLGAAEVARLQTRLNLDGVGILACLALGYFCILFVTIRQGRRYMRTRAEIELATEIHQVLVPEIELKMADYEFYGRSVPSGDVGGDLVDVAGAEENWVAYLADVSGHGVAPGVVMGMVKSAARMLLRSGGDAGEFLGKMNEVLYPLKKPDMFVTFAFLARAGKQLRMGLAGHPAILQFSAQKNAVMELEVSNLPLGILPNGEFAISEISAEPGDVFALYTDGFLETANASGEEFGLARFEEELKSHGREPLRNIFVALQESVARHGAQFDDQSLLLIRRI